MPLKKHFKWVDNDKMNHATVGLMIFFISYFMVGLSPSVAMVLVTAAGIVKEHFDKQRHRIGFKPGYFDKYDVVATMTGGAIGVTAVGIFEGVILLISLFT